VLLAFYAIYSKLANNTSLDLNKFLIILKESGVFTIKTVSLLAFLSILNWFLEILKWKLLVGTITKINLKSATEQSLGSLTSSVFTPNRIGEYAAKLMYFPKKNRKSIIALNFLGNMMQMSVTTFFGIVALLGFQIQYQIELLNPNTITFGFVALGLLGFMIFRFRNRQFKIKGIAFSTLKRFFRQIPKLIYSKGLLFSMARYFIFSFQFYLLLYSFNVGLGYLDSMMIISSMYFLASIIPSIFIFDVVIKGGVATYLFAIAGVSTISTLSIISLMWLLNFAFPAIIGSYFVINFKRPE